MEEDKAQYRRDRIFAAVIIALLCIISVSTLTIDKKFMAKKEPVSTIVKVKNE